MNTVCMVLHTISCERWWHCLSCLQSKFLKLLKHWKKKSTRQGSFVLWTMWRPRGWTVEHSFHQDGACLVWVSEATMMSKVGTINSTGMLNHLCLDDKHKLKFSPYNNKYARRSTSNPDICLKIHSISNKKANYSSPLSNFFDVLYGQHFANKMG